jgi:Rieske Fe-S protein
VRIYQSHLSRRELLNGLIGAGAVGAAAVGAETAFGYLTGIEVPLPESIRVTGKALEVLAARQYVLVRYGPSPVMIFTGRDGELRALSAVCTHGQCNVRYRPEHDDILCGCHNGRFTVDGVNVPGTPPPTPLKKFFLRKMDDGSLVVRAEPFEADTASETPG